MGDRGREITLGIDVACRLRIKHRVLMRPAVTCGRVIGGCAMNTLTSRLRGRLMRPSTPGSTPYPREN
jgi:hypothetical protein